MKNCLFKKLKSEVNGELPEFGMASFECTKDFLCIALKSGTVITGSNIGLTDNPNSQTIITTLPYIVPGNDYVEIYIKSLSQTVNGIVNFNDFYHNLRNINPKNIGAGVAGYYNFPLHVISFSVNLRLAYLEDPNNIRFSGLLDVGDIVSEELEVFSTNASWVRGYIENIKSKKITKIGFQTKMIYGSIENLAKAQIAKGRISGRIEVNCMYCSNILFHNSAVGQNVVIVFGNNSATVKTADESTILATYNGSTWTYV